MITKIFQIKPFIILISFFFLQILVFLISAGLISIFDPNLKPLALVVFFTVNSIPILLWLLYTGYALYLKDEKSIRKNEFNKFKLSVLIIFFNILISSIIEAYKSSFNEVIIIPISILLGIFAIISIIYILHYWVKGFVRNYDKRIETKSDYLNYIYLLCLLPIGIYVIQKLIIEISKKEANK